MTKELTPAQKGAITRAKNKAAREAAEAQTTVAEAKVEAVEVIEQATEYVDAFSENDALVELTVSQVTPRISSQVRGAIYVSGIVIGAVATAAGSIAAVLQGDAQLIAVAVSGLGLSLTNLLARLNLSKPVAEAIG